MKLFGDRTFDQITNSRLFSLKQRTLPWRFSVHYKPGKENSFSDATSRNPAIMIDEPAVTSEEILAGIRVQDMEELKETALITDDGKHVRAVTWDLVREETSRDDHMLRLIALINSTFPYNKHEMPSELLPYWGIRHNLYVVDGVVLVKNQVLIPPQIRKLGCAGLPSMDHLLELSFLLTFVKRSLKSLHSAHQGVTGMNERAEGWSILAWNYNRYSVCSWQLYQLQQNHAATGTSTAN